MLLSFFLILAGVVLPSAAMPGEQQAEADNRSAASYESTHEAFRIAQTMFAVTQTAYDQLQTEEAELRTLEIQQTEFAQTLDAFSAMQTQAAEAKLSGTPTAAPGSMNGIPAAATPQPAVPDKTSSANTRPEIETVLGQIIEFGSWEQDNDPANGPEPIEWQVIRIEDDFALLLSVKGLEARPRHAELNDTDWSNSSLRAWLNGEFYENAFGTSGAEYIAQSFNSNPGNPETGNGSGRNTNDRIFLLSLEEAAAWLPTNAERVGGVSVYAETQGAIVSSGHGMWWLRTGGSDEGTSAFVDPDGSINGAGLDVDTGYLTVRPAFWLRLKGNKSGFMPQTPEPTPTQTFTPAPTVPTATLTPTNTPVPTATPTPTNTPKPTAIPVKVGDIITFGRYEQDDNENNGSEPVEWQVLAVENDRALLISRYALESKEYNEEYESVTWETCTLRSWLNGDFFDNTFSREEKSRILRVTNQNPDNAQSGVPGGNATKDKVFLLSIDEVNKYFKTTDERICKPSAYAKAHGPSYLEYYNYDTTPWTLRSPCRSYFAAGVDVVTSEGSFNTEAFYDPNVVRPAFWLDLSEEPKSVFSRDPAELSAADLSAGDMLIFGRYEQDKNKANGTEPIEWQVLAVENNSVLVISKYALVKKPYNEEMSDVTWETCTLREWLNNDFYYNAFNSEEKMRIREVTNQNPDNAEYGTEGGMETTDRIFLLSADEAQEYFKTRALRRCSLPYGNFGWWWLRSPGFRNIDAADVGIEGRIESTVVHYDKRLVRPAFWLDLDEKSGKISFNDPTIETAAESLAAKEAAARTFTFGHYEQDNNKNNGSEPIEWQVLAEESDRVLLISKYGLDNKKYNKAYEPVTWENCSLRKWLNGDFYNSAFSHEEKGRIRQVINQNPDSPNGEAEGGNATADHVFLLTAEEAREYFKTDEDRKCFATDYASANGAYVSENFGGTSMWWLRSPGADGKNALDVYFEGWIYLYGGSVNDDDKVVRPAIWLSLE